MIKMDKATRENLEKTVVYINGEYFSGIDAKISIFDLGFSRGYNVFDALSLWNGFIRKLDSHVRRFYESMHTVDLEISLSKEEFKEVIFETVRRSKLKEGEIFATSTYGMFELRIGEPASPERESTLIVDCRPYAWIGGQEAQKVGAKARIAKIKDYPIQCIEGRIKNNNRLNYYLAYMELRGTGATTPLMTDMDGYVGQSTGANLWAVKDGKLFTPKGNILYGITRETVLDIAKLEKIEAIETRLTPSQIYNADEAFLSSSSGGLIPIIEVDRRRIGDGKPGPITRRLTDTYWKMHVDPKYATKVPGLE
ncbi:Branched-chain-amino-acid aminotransferase [subsurface metagenome]